MDWITLTMTHLAAFGMGWLLTRLWHEDMEDDDG